MNQVNKTKFMLSEDYKSDGIMLAWPSIYENEIYWLDLLRVYYEIIKNCLVFNKNIVLIIQKGRDIKDDLRLVDEDITNIIKAKGELLQLYEIDYNDIWMRDYCPLTLINESNNKYYFNIASFNGYGNKYACDKDKVLSLKFIKKYQDQNNRYQKEYFEIFNDLIIEPGNITFDKNLIIMNKTPLLLHNDLDWKSINNILKNGIEDFLGVRYEIINVKPIDGDDTSGHIDNLIRLENTNYLYYMATNDSKHPDYKLLMNLRDQIMRINFVNKKIIPIYHDHHDVVRDSENNILPFSYLNYIRIGDLIIMPINKNTSIYKKNRIKRIFEYADVIFIEISCLLHERGGLHCCSMNI
tara:strand:- start:235 stop:1296 length:1062 start_codon:yes stop_codon:yes gene_type:complete